MVNLWPWCFIWLMITFNIELNHLGEWFFNWHLPIVVYSGVAIIFDLTFGILSIQKELDIFLRFVRLTLYCSTFFRFNLVRVNAVRTYVRTHEIHNVISFCELSRILKSDQVWYPSFVDLFSSFSLLSFLIYHIQCVDPLHGTLCLVRVNINRTRVYCCYTY